MDNAEERPSIQVQIDRINGRISCISDAQRRFIGLVEHYLRADGQTGAFIPVLEAMRASMEARPANEAAIGGYLFELAKIEQLIHRPNPSHPAGTDEDQG